MDIQPILKALRRQKTAAFLIAFEIALACAIICNALFLIIQRVERSQMPSGVAEAELLRIQTASLDNAEDQLGRVQEDVAGLRGLPGVASVAVTQQVPFGGSSWNSGLKTEPDQRNSVANATMYFDGGDLLETLGLKLVAGRNFLPEEYHDFQQLVSGEVDEAAVVIISRALSETLWPGEPLLTHPLYMGDDEPVRVIGVVETLVRPSIFDDSAAQYSMIMPVRGAPGAQYLIRTEPGVSPDTLAEPARAKLRELQPNRIVLNVDAFRALREGNFRQDRVMAGLLMTVIVALLIVTALGIVGLASFWVQRRQRHIGIRRALGATRGAVMRYFQAENFLIVSVGVAVGMFAAYAINAWLMTHYELPRLPLYYLPVGAIGLWTLGQISVLGPAMRAMRVPPALATKG